jgi:hypothetical protein
MPTQPQTRVHEYLAMSSGHDRQRSKKEIRSIQKSVRELNRIPISSYLDAAGTSTITPLNRTIDGSFRRQSLREA